MLDIITEQNGLLVVTFSTGYEKLTIANAENLKEKLIQLFDEGNKNIILDFLNLNFIDSTGFGALVTVYNFANNCYGKLILCGMKPETMELVKITKLDQVFDIYKGVPEAKNSII